MRTGGWVLSLCMALAAPMAVAETNQSADPTATQEIALDPGLGPLELTQQAAEKVTQKIRANRSLYEQDSAALYAMVDDLVDSVFDFRTMSLLVLGPNWKSASEEQRERFMLAFKNLLIRTYSKALLQAGDAAIEWEPLELEPGEKRTMVRAAVPTSSGPVKIAWRLRKLSEGWRVFDVVVDGISLVTNYRGSYSAEIRKSGLDALIEKMEQQNPDANGVSA
nr:ABC transporter substrate-binding protein [Oceanococcus sp. HetDA_MAG_MS8]